jgi:hypothetical protein
MQVISLAALFVLTRAPAGDLQPPGIQQVEFTGLLLFARQIGNYDHIVVVFPDIHLELTPDCGQHAIVHSPGRQEPAPV